MEIIVDDLTGPEIAEFLAAHVAELQSVSPPESTHALDLDALRRPEITFWSMRDGGTVVGCGALKELDADHAELKSMRIAPAHQNRGLASRLLVHITEAAQQRGFSRLSLETGSFDFFAPARHLYAKHGFTPCEPFADYRPDPNSVFLTKQLQPGRAGSARA
ncbi:GNAT family N-acetyltransferase [Saccharopolyspora hirsuta]|uniref:GNAT family N-acetyltransferase n=1 Tax=Saccharopolyspora hirsuta TaxID=1837 RepID=A0A5M7BIS7_SACHI|nr:GNAT family N-acetyltransferase [Saccharopolyspora hirsuta]KAA5829572.1 GNAT family N-acetyltransferase [Saccharopolyspora hirsuta]MBF6511066.1 GNAT family N-acetyltransferase [Nocardia farcinica]